MHIVFFANHFFPSVGGVQWSVLRTAEALTRRGQRVTLVTETPSGEEGSDEALPFEILRFRVPLRRPFTRFGYWRWMWIRRDALNAADVLHFHDYTTFFHWFLPLRILIRRPRYAVTFHGYEGWPIRNHHRLFRSVTARLCHVRFAVGEYVRRFYGHPVDAVYIGAPVRDLLRSRQTDDAVFSYAGRFSGDTGILPLLRALARVTEGEGIIARVLLIGDGPLRDEIAALQGPMLRMEFLGVAARTEQLYEQTRYVIATGYLGIFEAFASGIPTLIPTGTAIRREYVRSIPDAARMCTEMDSEDETEALLRRILRREMDEDLHAKAETAFAFVSQLDWDDIAVLLEYWYDNTATSERRRPSSQLAVMASRRKDGHAY